MFQAPVLPQGTPTSSPMLPSSFAARPASRAGAVPGFVVGLILGDAGVAISFPAVETGAPGAGVALVERVESLLPGSLDIFTVHSASPELGGFFGRLRAERLPAGFMILDLRGGDEAGLAPLAAALIAALPEDMAGAVLYADAIGAIIAAREAKEARGGASGRRRSCGMLPKWRLKRVMDYIDAHLDEPITLADLGAAAKLTRMHFAAQFRATTGLRPHEYLLRQRIERAKTLLLDDDLAIVEVALAVGFQTQAHFTTIFGRFVGETPYQWRRARAAERKSAATRSAFARVGRNRPSAGVPLGMA